MLCCDLTNMRFGRLLCVSLLPERQNAGALWLCICDCGAERKVTAKNLKAGRAQSCGCRHSELISARNATHGLTHTPEYNVWLQIGARCSNPNAVSYARYGGRGIRNNYRTFEGFLEDLGPRPSTSHTVDRIDCNGHYEPGNCRWATKLEQANNTRSNVFVTAFGQTKTMADWARSSGLRYNVLKNRLRRGWDPEKAMNEPQRPLRKRGGGQLVECIKSYGLREQEVAA